MKTNTRNDPASAENGVNCEFAMDRVDRKGSDENCTNRRQLLWSPAHTIGLRAPAFLDGQQKLACCANEVFKR